MKKQVVKTFTFYSNFLMHHQLPFCLEMVKRYGNNFTFVATEDINKDLKAFWHSDENMNEKYPFVLKAYESEENLQQALKLAEESDVVVVGSAPEKYINVRMKKNKLTFRYTERPLKKGRSELLNIRKLHTMMRLHTTKCFKPLYLLCASAYTAGDCAMVGGYWGKAYKWGYFPEVKTYENVDKLMEWKHPASILWVGRLLEWKHPEFAVKTAKRLRDEGVKFDMNIIGSGPLEKSLKEQIELNGLTDCVHLQSSKTPEEVREYMEKSQVYIFTSDRNEGWGAVLNESMNSACAVVADYHIGSAPFLLDNGVNGFLYDGTECDLYDKVKRCLCDTELAQTLGRNAYDSMQKLWNPAVAVERITLLSEALLNGEKTDYKEGPCSRAKWM